MCERCRPYQQHFMPVTYRQWLQMCDVLEKAIDSGDLDPMDWSWSPDELREERPPTLHQHYRCTLCERQFELRIANGKGLWRIHSGAHLRQTAEV